ncbi:uncharacterized protein IWZ02DRAFT_275844 [Phyllosticta citriasiana]|uniref:uncharacterized protein n=1 Tax=Phyllosticta citriasiana TaxID=595635 RepID=UPI0030FDC0D9
MHAGLPHAHPFFFFFFFFSVLEILAHCPDDSMKFSGQGEECLASRERQSGALRRVAQVLGQEATREPILPASVSKGSTPCASRPGAVFEGVHNRVVNIQGLRSFSCLFCHIPPRIVPAFRLSWTANPRLVGDAVAEAIQSRSWFRRPDKEVKMATSCWRREAHGQWKVLGQYSDNAGQAMDECVESCSATPDMHQVSGRRLFAGPDTAVKTMRCGDVLHVGFGDCFRQRVQ